MYRPTAISTHTSEQVAWTMARRAVDPALRCAVESYTGYEERTARPLERAELPGPRAVLIIELDEPITVGGARHRGGFVAGLDDGPTATAHAGHQRGIQLNLTPHGARRLLGVPMAELTRQVVSLDDLWPGLHLAERLHELPTWAARFDTLEAVLRARLGDAPATHRAVSWAVERIVGSGGAIDVASLTAELGYSPKHVVALFHEHVGLPPKLLARLVRFDRLVSRLGAGAARPSWASLAQELGYYDQAHLARDVRQLAGMTPTALARLRADLGALDGAPT